MLFIAQEALGILEMLGMLEQNSSSLWKSVWELLPSLGRRVHQPPSVVGVRWRLSIYRDQGLLGSFGAFGPRSIAVCFGSWCNKFLYFWLEPPDLGTELLLCVQSWSWLYLFSQHLSKIITVFCRWSKWISQGPPGHRERVRTVFSLCESVSWQKIP